MHLLKASILNYLLALIEENIICEYLVSKIK